MKLLGLLMPVLSLVSTIAFIWLTVVAFKRSTLWGFLVLFLSPITAVIFAIKNWEESKKPFLIYAGSIAGVFAIVISMVAFMGGFAMMAMAEAAGELDEAEVQLFMNEAMDKMENSGMLDDQEQADLDKMRLTINEAPDQEAPAQTSNLQASIEVLPATSGQLDPGNGLRVRSDYEEQAIQAVAPGGVVPMHRANDYVGKFLKVRLQDGLEYEGRLASFNADGLQLNRHLSSGVIAIHVARADIRSLQLAKR